MQICLQGFCAWALSYLLKLAAKNYLFYWKKKKKKKLCLFLIVLSIYSESNGFWNSHKKLILSTIYHSC